METQRYEKVKSIGKGIAQVACKASYPVLGNLSRNLQFRIEDMLGRKYYDAYKATKTSICYNIVPIYPSLGAIMGYYKSDCHLAGAIFPAIFGFLYGLVEAGLFRDPDEEGYLLFCGDYAFPAASIPGKIVSIPFDIATYAYDAGKKCLQCVKQRTDSGTGQKNLDDKVDELGDK